MFKIEENFSNGFSAAFIKIDSQKTKTLRWQVDIITNVTRHGVKLILQLYLSDGTAFQNLI